MAFDWSAVASAGTGLINGIISHFDNKALREAQTSASNQEYNLGLQNLAFNQQIAQQNLAQQEMAFNYQKELNNLMMEREDNAMQRKVADLKKAGLSPLMATEGSQAGNLLSGNAPQMDVAGINSATQSLQNARKDYATRKLQETQFKLQSRLQIAQLSADVLGAMQEYQKNKLDYEYQKGLNEFVLKHGYRDINWKSELVNMLEKLMGKWNPSSVGDKVQEGLQIGKESVDKLVDGLGKLINVPDLQSDDNPVRHFMTYGSVDSKTSFGHMLDNENYDNDRPTWQLLKEEAKEKILKNQLRNENSDDIAGKLWDTDDYLKKHITKENWLKTSWEFRKNYLKYGYFK